MKKTLVYLLTLAIAQGCAYSNVRDLHPRAYNSVLPQQEITAKSRNPKKIEEIINYLENVPDSIQQRCNEFGGYIVIFDGKITDQEGLKHLKGKKPEFYSEESTWDDVNGLYNHLTKRVFINQNHESQDSVELHEYGHLVDNAFRGISRKKEFKEIFEEYKKEKTWFIFTIGNNMTWHESRSPTEFFAECFRKYYQSGYTREELKDDFPKAHKCIETLIKH